MLVSSNTSKTDNKSAKPILRSAALKLPPKAVLIRNYAPLRSTDKDNTAHETYCGKTRFPVNQVGILQK